MDRHRCTCGRLCHGIGPMKKDSGRHGCSICKQPGHYAAQHYAVQRNCWRCSKCRIEKPLDKFYPANTPSRVRSRCIECEKADKKVKHRVLVAK